MYDPMRRLTSAIVTGSCITKLESFPLASLLPTLAWAGAGLVQSDPHMSIGRIQVLEKAVVQKGASWATKILLSPGVCPKTSTSDSHC